MRTLRLSVVATVVLALLGSVAAIAVAQEASDQESTTLSFTMPYGRQTATGSADVHDGFIARRDVPYTGRFEANDPRLSGELWSVHNWDRYSGSQGAVIVGRAGIDQDVGAWEGTFHGYASPNDEHIYYQLDLAGEGAYDGLSALVFIVDTGSGFDVEGLVYPGALPPLPEPRAE